MATALPAGYADVRHTASNRPPPSIPMPRNPRRRPIKRAAPASPCAAPPWGFFPQIRRRPCLEAPWGFFLLVAPQSRGGGEDVSGEGGPEGAGAMSIPEPLFVRKKERMKEWGRRREGGRGSCTAAPPTDAAEGRLRAAGPPRRCPACRRGRLRRGCRAWPLRSRSSPSQGRRRPSRSHPWSSRHRGIGAGPAGRRRRVALLPLQQAGPRSSSSALGRSTLLVTTSSPPCLEREVSTEAFTLLWTRPSSRGWTEPCELAACVLPAVPHRAAAQTRRRLRAGHRAEPVVCRCRCLRQHARSLLCIVLILSRRARVEFRLAVGTYTLSTPPSSEGPAFLGPGVR
jgi:hypothetical protein